MACTNNVLQNGDFASNSFASWSFTNNGTATASASTGAAVVNVTTGGTNTRLSQNGFSLVAGQTYTVEFTASSTAAASMQVRAIQHASPNTFAGLNETVALTTTPQTYSFTFTSAITEPDARLYFSFNGITNSIVTIDNVCLGDPTLTCYITVADAFACPGNMIGDPSFTDGNASNDWQALTAGSSTVGYGTGEAVIDAVTAGTNGIAQRLDVVQNTIYEYSFKARATPAATVTASMINAGTNANLGLAGTHNATTAMATYTGTFTANATTSGNVGEFRLTMPTVGDLFIDDVCLRAVGTVAYINAEFSSIPTSNGVVGQVFSFTDESSSDTTITSRQWHYSSNNGLTWTQFSTATNPTFSFPANGNYLVRLTATSASGTDTAQYPYTIAANSSTITLDADKDGGPIPLTVVFDETVTSTGTPANTSVYEYSTNNGATWTQFATAVDPSHTFTTHGTYQVRVRKQFTYLNGSTETVTSNVVTITTNQTTLQISSGATQACANAPTQFSQSIVTTGTMNSLTWQRSSDGGITWTTFATGTNPTASLPSGDYQIRAQAAITYPDGSTETVTSNSFGFRAIAVDAAFTSSPTSGTAPLAVSFANASVNATSYAWTFGDGGSSTAQAPLHTFTTPGTYTVTLTATGACGSDVATQTITVAAPGTIDANFTATPTSGLYPLATVFTDTTTATNGVTSWLWDFGDGTTSTARNPSHTYSAPGVYTVRLTATGPDGVSTEVKTNYIVATTTSTEACKGTLACIDKKGCITPVKPGQLGQVLMWMENGPAWVTLPQQGG